MRKVFIIAMYDKVGKLSLKSLSETNSGKLITLISSDIFAVEKGMTMSPFVIVGPMMNIAVLTILAV